mmetsp:Transcript_65686/g.201290  ORF Transcript_65686/g.201290 Transcript_65686/m.201290 type:complete len:216 (+) Transcript_65686:1293-1940(+)
MHVFLDEAQAARPQRRDGAEHPLVYGEEAESNLHEPMRRTVVVHVSDAEHVAGPIDLLVLGALRVKLLAQRSRHRVPGRVVAEPLAVEVAEGDVHHPGVAPESARVHREPRGQQPQLRRHRRQAPVVEDAEHRQPQLRPMCGVKDPPVLADERPALHASGIVRQSSQQAEGNVIQGAAKQGAGRLDVRTPPAVRLLVVPQVHLGCSPKRRWQYLL